MIESDPPLNEGLAPESEVSSESLAEESAAPSEPVWDLAPLLEPPVIPGPGLGEAIAWLVGALATHIVAAIAVAVLVIVVMVVQSGGASPAMSFSPMQMVQVIAGEQFLTLLATFLAISLRMRGRVFAELNLRPPDFRHLCIALIGVLPLSMVVSTASIPGHLAWEQLTDWLPLLKLIDGLNSMTALKELVQVAPLPLLILVISVGPAIGEELIFRGVIGRGLVARWGVMGGVLLTSILFGIMHLHPVHALAVIPLGIAMHLAYLWSRSFWLPMLMHFLNNCWATLATQISLGERTSAPALQSGMDWTECLAAVVCVVALGRLFWLSRVRYLRADGTEWNPGYVSTGVPTEGGFSAVAGATSRVWWWVAGVSATVFHATLFVDLAMVNPQ